MGLKEGEVGCDGALASDADGRSPKEPGMTLVSSDRLKWYGGEQSALICRTLCSGSHVPE